MPWEHRILAVTGAWLLALIASEMGPSSASVSPGHWAGESCPVCENSSGTANLAESLH